MKLHHSLPVLIIFLALLLAACQADANTSELKTTITPVLAALMQDDFSDPESGWTIFSGQDGLNDYQNGGFRILVNNEQYYFWSNPGRSFKDVVIEVDAKKLDGPDNNDYGVICRYQDVENFYFFTIGSDGYYGISKYTKDGDSLLGMSSLGKNTDVILGGDATNHIKVTCSGSSLKLEVNGTLLAEAEDADFTSGDIGLIAGSNDTVGVDVLFDNLMVTLP
jgi:hypothetical protein